jgi:hypothetical protein
MSRIALILILGLTGCAFDGAEPPSDVQATLDNPTTLLPESYTPTGEDETSYFGAVTLFPGGSAAFPIPTIAKQVMPWYSANPNVREGEVYFNVGDSRHAYLEFNPPRAPLWVPIPENCNRAFMRNDSGETISVGIVFSTQE